MYFPLCIPAIIVEEVRIGVMQARCFTFTDRSVHNPEMYHDG